MRLSLVPRERRFFELFRQQGQLVSESLTELSKSLLEGRSRHPGCGTWSTVATT